MIRVNYEFIVTVAHSLRCCGLAVLILCAFPSALAAGAGVHPLGGFDLYKHRGWTLEDGAPPDIWAIAQAQNGYLWLGTGAGLYRFDGIRFEHFLPAPGEQLAGANINALLATANGDLWIGYHSGGISLLRAGHLHNFIAGIPNGSVGGLAAVGPNDVWASVEGAPEGGLTHFDGSVWTTVDRAVGLPKGPIFDIKLDIAGNLWVATLDQVFARAARAPLFKPVGERLGNRPSHLVAAPQGGVWSAVRHFGENYLSLSAAGRERPPFPTAKHRDPPLLGDNLFFDSSGAMWGKLESGGLFQIRSEMINPPRSPLPADMASSTFSTADGLSADEVRPIFEDREGTIWVGTNGGLDRFRPANIVRETAIPLSFGEPYFGDVDIHGNVHVGSSRTLYVIPGFGQSRRFAAQPLTNGEICSDGRAALWTVTDAGRLLTFKEGHAKPVSPLPGRNPNILTCARDPTNRVWLSVAGGGLLRQKADFRPLFDRQSVPVTDAEMLFFGPTGTLWFVTRAGKLGLFDGATSRLFTERDGPQVGKIQMVFAGSEDVLIGGDLGLARYAKGRFQSLGADAFPFLSRVTGIAQHGENTWLFGITGLAEVRSDALRSAFARPGVQLVPRMFDSRDGLPGSALQDWEFNTLLKGRTGRLWLFTNNGVGSFDPDHLIANPVPPPVTISLLTAAGKAYVNGPPIILPKGVTDIHIDYAALSLAVPERVQVLYKLDKVDDDWIASGARRQAFYTNLEPGSYRFHVIAANESGVWNERGQTLDFTIVPTFVQTLGFRLLCLLIVLVLVLLSYIVRLRQMGRTMQIRVEERVGERERIARELHDTLLQGMQGLLLRFQAAANRLPKGNIERTMIDRALDSAEEIIVDGRTSLMGLRTPPPPVELKQHFTHYMQKQVLNFPARFDVVERGDIRPLAADVHHETLRIGEEAGFNALRHGRPTLVEILIDHGSRQFSVTIRDDGHGIAPFVLKGGAPEGHFGLAGMKERARRVRGRLRIESELNRGTTVLLTVPKRSAYDHMLGWWSPRRWITRIR